LTCFDLAEKQQLRAENLQSSVKNSMFIGEKLNGKIKSTIKNDSCAFYD